MSDPTTSVELRHILWRLYRDAADDDYLVARWCCISCIPYAFYWNAQQALEKYIKGALLLNSVSVKNIAHDLEKGFELAESTFGNLIPILLVPPNEFHLTPPGPSLFNSSVEETRVFVARVNNAGQTSNRYRNYSLIFPRSDLHKLDELCFILRRLCFPLDFLMNEVGLSYRDQILRDPNYQPHLPLHPLESKSRGENDERLRFAELMNFSFFRERSQAAGKYLSGGGEMINSPLYLAYENQTAENKKAIDWLLAHTQFSKAEALELRRAFSLPAPP